MSKETPLEKRLGTPLFYGFILLVAYLLFRVIQPFLAPLCWAAVFAVVFYPAKERMERRWGRTAAASACTLCVTLILIVPALAVTAAFVRQGIAATRSAQQAILSGQLVWLEHGWQWMARHVPGENPASLGQILRQDAEKLATRAAAEVGVIVRHVAVFLFDLAVVILAMFYLFRDGDRIMVRLREVLPVAAEARERMIVEAHELIFASVTSSLVAAVIHGLFGGIAFGLVGIGAPVFWGVMMAFFSLLPLVGSAVIWVPAAMILAARGHWGRGVILAVILAGIVGVVDNVVRPWLISGRARLSGLVVFISVLGGIEVFGMLGVILGPIVVATATSILDFYTRGGPAPPPSPKAVGQGPRAVLE